MSPPLTVASEEYSPLVKAMNAMAGVASWMRMPFTAFDVDSVVRAARRSTGLDDWGDPEFLEAMQALFRGIQGDARFTPLARVFMRRICIQAVENRLLTEQWFAAHPAAEHQEVRRPIFVLGFPRTGTTVLQNLLCRLDDRRAIEFWELTKPVPVHDDATIDVRRRIRIAERTLQMAYVVAPEMTDVHEIKATTPEECWPLFSNGFAVLNYYLQSGMADYGDFLMQHDMRGPYAEYKRQLQMICFRQPERDLVLKCPEHLWFLDSLLHNFPDACIVQTHRDPVEVIASYCSLISLTWRVNFGKFDPHVLGRFITDTFFVGIERAMAVREQAGPERFFDVSFVDLVRDPSTTVHQIIDHFDLPEPADLDQRIEAWLASDRGDKRGKHHYSVERYGLDPDAIYARYAAYTERFGVARTR